MSERNQRQTNQFFATLLTKLRKWLIKIGSPFRLSRRFIRSLLNQNARRTRGRGKATQSGFVLPTVVMVTLVVSLLVVVTVSRSSERARTASNARVEQAVRVTTAPAIDRAKAKIDALLNDDALGRGTPSDQTLYTAFNNAKYTFKDEIRLQIVQNTDSVTTISSSEVINTAWKYPVDTDSDGKYDSFTLYSIQFQAPPLNSTTGIPSRQVAVTEARTAPMDESTTTGTCINSASSSVGQGWYSANGKQKKAFFVYAATVPITQDNVTTTVSQIPGVSSTNASKFEFATGNLTFTALELQQDRARTPLNNNAVWFEDDLELARSATFRLNGRVFTNSNLMVGASGSNPITFFQVSSPSSCYYNADNAKILVAGNLLNGDTITGDDSLASVATHLYQGAGVAPDTTQSIGSSTKTVSNYGKEAGFNNDAFSRRLNALRIAAKQRNSGGVVSVSSLQAASTFNPTAAQKAIYPTSVLQDMFNGTSEDDALNTYFKNRLRKVPFLECNFGSCTGETGANASDTSYATQANINGFLSSTNTPSTLTTSNGVLSVSGGIELSPPEKWMLPPYQSAPSGYTLGGGTSFPTGSTNDLTFSGSNLRAYDPAVVKSSGGIETLLGDRILVGNNLPGLWYNTSQPNLFAGSTVQNLFGGSINWNNTGATARYGFTQVNTLADLGDTDRDGFWENAAAASPTFTSTKDTSGTANADERQCKSSGATGGCNNISPVYGGLRVITGAGIYSSANSFLPTRPTLYDSTNSVIDTYVNNETNSSTSNVNESAFNSYVVWPDTMPMTPAVRWLNSNTYPNRTTAGYYAVDYTQADGWAASPTTNPLRGDLQMRASAIYHYKASVYDSVSPPATASTSDNGGYQKPLACVSSYYDPTNPTTAKNKTSWGSSTARNLVDVGYGLGDDGRSNNGVVYAIPSNATTSVNLTMASGISYGTSSGLFTGMAANANNPTDTTVALGDRLAYQANLVFPNGRFVNTPLRSALRKVVSASGKAANAAGLTLSEQAAIDAAICALKIDTGEYQPDNSIIPHGAFKEASFLDGREVKSLTKNETTMQNGSSQSIYDLEIEQRQPLEIRVTDIDIDKLRSTTITATKISGIISTPNNNNASTGVPTEYLLPYSGLVYATREDALPDLSDNSSVSLATRKQLSPTDFKLDPTRRPNAIRLINGQRLWRGSGTTQGNWTTASKGEKGLVLATNLPIYIKGDFNRHTHEEFTTTVDATWSNFYTRSTIDNDFACRPDGGNGSPKPSCTGGDEWRSATILSDSPTVLSGNSVDGFRDSGDFDIRNNIDTNSNSYTALGFMRKGLWNNNFVAGANWLQAGTNTTVYPLTASSASSAGLTPQLTTYFGNGVTPVQRRVPFGEYSMEICRKLPVSECTPTDWVDDNAGTTVLPTLSGTVNSNNPWGTGGTPTTAPRYVHPDDLRFPRRVAFLRNSDIYSDTPGDRSLVLSPACVTGDQSWPIPLAVNNGNAAAGYTYGYVNTTPSCKVTASSASASVSSASSSSASVSSASSSSASVSSASVSRSSASASSASSASSSSLSASAASISSASSASLSAASSSFAASLSSSSASSASASASSASSSSRSSASASSASAASSVSASSISASASRSSASASSASSVSASASSASASSASAASSVSASSISRSASASSVSASVSSASISRSAASASSASSASASASSVSSAASSVSASSSSASVSSASSSSLSASSASSASRSSASSASISASSASRSASSASSASRSSASSASISRSSASASSASSASISASSASASSASRSSASSASIASASSSSASVSSASIASASASSASISSASSSSRSAVSASASSIAAGGVTMLHTPTFGGLMPRLPMSTILPSVSASGGTNRVAAVFPDSDLLPTGATQGSMARTYESANALLKQTAAGTNPFNASVPAANDNALWYRTIASNAASSASLGNPTQIRFDATGPLYMYVPYGDGSTPSANIAKQEANKVLLPDTLCILTDNTNSTVAPCTLASPNAQLTTTSSIYNSGSTSYSYNGVTFSSAPYLLSLNSDYSDAGLDYISGSSSAPSDYGVCTGNSPTGAAFQGYKANNTNPASSYDPNSILGTGTGICPASVLTQIQTFAGYANSAPTGIELMANTITNPSIPNNPSGPYSLSSSDGSSGSVTLLKTTGPSGTTSVTNLTLNSPGQKSGEVVVYDFPNCEIGTNGDATISLNATKPDTVFILRTVKANCNGTGQTTTLGNYDSSDGSGYVVTMSLNGVSPNNIFWDIGRNGGSKLNIYAPSPTHPTLGNKRTVLIGNILGQGGPNGDPVSTTIGENVEIRGGRFLGWKTAPNLTASTNQSNDRFTAVTADSEPLLLPVVQFHAPGATTTTSSGTTLDQTGLINGNSGRWTQNAATTTVNAYFVSGNTPSRSFVSYTTSNKATPANTAVTTGETGGGLSNFIRFLENWSDTSTANSRVDLTISGGFIQTRRSIFATAPFSSTAPYTDLSQLSNALVGNSSDIQSLFKDPNNGIQQEYYISNTGQVIPFYDAPNRKWGYDVGLLTQPADLFALRFSGAVATPNEFFREVDRTDKYIQALLCSLQPAGVASDSTGAKQAGGSNILYNTYTEFAVSLSQREASGNTCSNIPGYTPGTTSATINPY